MARRPTTPSSYRPATPANGTEHVTPEYPRADTAEPLRRDLVVDPRFPTIRIALHLLPDARVEEPVHEQGATDAERVLQVLVWPGAEAVERHRKAVDTEF